LALLDVILGYDCNLACDYCTITREMRARALSTGAVVRAMREARAAGYDAVALTGGEPTIRPDLVGLVRTARELGFEDVKVQTNGLLLSHAPNLARLLGAGVTRVHLSIHTHLEAPYDALVRRAGSHALMARALDSLVASGIDLTVDAILKSDTWARLPDAIRWLDARGVRQVDLWLVSLTDGNREHLASLARISEMLPAIHEALAIGRARGMRVRSLHLPRCLLGPDAAHAHDPGRDRVMVLTPDDRFELADSKITPSVHVAACDGCEHRSVCPGVRPDYLEAWGDHEIAAARGQAPSVHPTRRALTVI
jgi:molybdenum cofactor biosynthesis enzyme MoaA